MLFPLIAGGAIAALVFGKRKPKGGTQVVQATSIGAVTGQIYTVDHVPAVGSMVVRQMAPGLPFGEMALQKRNGRWHYVHGKGDAMTLERMKRDFRVVMPSTEQSDTHANPGGSS
jgi:hypothetical protein